MDITAKLHRFKFIKNNIGGIYADLEKTNKRFRQDNITG